MPRPKTYPWEQVAAALAQRGFTDAARAVAAEFGPPPPLCSDVDVRRALQVLESGEVKPEALTERTISRCLAEFALSSSRVTSWLVSWLNQTRENFNSNAMSPPRQTRQSRSPITDPEVLAKRSEALVKARAARQARIAERQRRAERDDVASAIAATAEEVDERVPAQVG